MRTKLLVKLSNAAETAGTEERATHDAVHNDMLIPGICGILRIHRSRQGTAACRGGSRALSTRQVLVMVIS